jgi:molybdopterin synthase catalytic subunit
VSEPAEIEVEVLLFARARELAGRDRLRLRLRQGGTVRDAAAALSAACPALERCLEVSRIGVNEEFAGPGDPVPAGAVLAVIPPVSGGV